jgi:hypothetical protein
MDVWLVGNTAQKGRQNVIKNIKRKSELILYAYHVILQWVKRLAAQFCRLR